MFNIFRVAKLKTLGEVGASSQHTLRTRDTPNADPLGIKPIKWIGGDKGPLDDVQRALPTKRRKNAVIAIECLLTASPEFFGDWKNGTDKDIRKMKAFFKAGLDRLKQVFGDENVVSAYIHMDESTPHMVCYVTPLKDGKLNARHFIGGTDGKEKLSLIQDLMHDAVQHLGLQRGTRNSQAKHQDIKSFYGSMKRLEEEAQEKSKRISMELQEAQDLKAAVAEEKRYLSMVFQGMNEREKADIRNESKERMRHETHKGKHRSVP